MKFFKSFFVVSSFTFLSKIFGFFRDLLLAKYLGAGVVSDSFFAAFKMPNLFRKIFAEGALNIAFVPIFSSGLKTEGKEKMINFTRNIFSIILIILIVFVILCEIFMPFLIRITAPGFEKDIEKFTLTVTLSRIMFPSLMFLCYLTLLSGILNSFNKFNATSFASVILNIAMISAAFAIPYLKLENEVAYVFSFSVLIGHFLTMIWIIYSLAKDGIYILPIKPTFTQDVKSFFNKFFNSILGSGIVQISTMVDMIMASLIPSAVSYIYYADRLMNLPLALIGTAISTSTLPLLSRSCGNTICKRLLQQRLLFFALFFTLPAGIVLFFYAHPIVSILFERDNFTAENAVIVANLLKIYSTGLIALISLKILQNSFYSNKDTKTPMLVGLFCLCLNILLNLILMKQISFYGIIVSTIFSTFTNIFILSYLLAKRGELKFSKRVRKIIYKMIILVLILILSGFILTKFFPVYNKNIFIEIIKLCIACSILGIIYLFLSFAMKIFDIRFILKLILKKSKK